MNKKFPTSQDALTYLESKGKLTYFGRAGWDYEYGVYTLELPDGRAYFVDVYFDGEKAGEIKVTPKK